MHCRMLCRCSAACPVGRAGSWPINATPAMAFAGTSGMRALARRSRRSAMRRLSPARAYVNRNRVERLWARLKEWRAVATRYETTATSFRGVLCLAATIDWLKT